MAQYSIIIIIPVNIFLIEMFSYIKMSFLHQLKNIYSVFHASTIVLFLTLIYVETTSLYMPYTM